MSISGLKEKNIYAFSENTKVLSIIPWSEKINHSFYLFFYLGLFIDGKD